jgi:predicted PurR-regulated permease PerM
MCGSSNISGAKYCNYCGSLLQGDENQQDCNQNQTRNNNNTKVYNVDLHKSQFSAHNNNEAAQQTSHQIKTYLTHSIVALVISVIFICCLQEFSIITFGMGIAAVVFANQTEKLLRDGNFEEAKKKSKLARIFFLSCIITSLVISIATFIMTFIFIFTTISQMGGYIEQFANPQDMEQMKKMFDEIMRQVQEQQKGL